jgi:hypothetical protein
MTFPATPQTIWEGDEYGDGTTRRIQARGDGSYIALDRAVLDGKYWHQITMFVIKNREQAIAVRMAIDTYLETPLPPALQQTGIEMAKEAWAVLQAASRLVGYCRSIANTPARGLNGSPDYLPQSQQWVDGLLGEADRVAALIDGAVEPIGPVPPRGGNPVAWDGKHVAPIEIDLIVEPCPVEYADSPWWKLSDQFGEEISFNLTGLDWLADLLPRVLESYRSHTSEGNHEED